jgi:hypothetical protein
MVRSDNESVDEKSTETISDDDFFRKYQNQFNVKQETDHENRYDSDDDYLEEESIFDKIREWFINLKNKIINK